jgi:hypothetical protein
MTADSPISEMISKARARDRAETPGRADAASSITTSHIPTLTRQLYHKHCQINGVIDLTLTFQARRKCDCEDVAGYPRHRGAKHLFQEKRG